MDQLENSSTAPIVLYVTVGVAVLLLLMRGLAAFMGPLGDFLEKRRHIVQSSEDARIRDLTGQVLHLAGRVDDLEAEDEQQLSLITAHATWDYVVMEALIKNGIEVPKPPPLRPPLQRSHP